mgnify:CR=1 FL=1
MRVISYTVDYYEYTIELKPRMPAADLLVTELGESGFESFEDTPLGFKAYIPVSAVTTETILPLTNWDENIAQLLYTACIIPGQNWNSVWESNFQPVVVADRCVIRAPFHEPVPGMEYELVIAPQMSFGTGHHETTALMVEKLLTMELAGQTVMDMGCGTGVLGILAAKRGAVGVQGIDTEDNAVENAQENVARNLPPAASGMSAMSVEKGDERLLPGRRFNLILANINKNVLRASLPLYADALEMNGNLVLSGFFVTDEQELKEIATGCGLIFAANASKNNWSLLHFIKK